MHNKTDMAFEFTQWTVTSGKDKDVAICVSSVVHFVVVVVLLFIHLFLFGFSFGLFGFLFVVFVFGFPGTHAVDQASCTFWECHEFIKNGYHLRKKKRAHDYKHEFWVTAKVNSEGLLPTEVTDRRGRRGGASESKHPMRRELALGWVPTTIGREGKEIFLTNRWRSASFSIRMGNFRWQGHRRWERK